MTVFILMGNSGKDEFDNVLGVYSTEQKAEVAKTKKLNFSGKPWKETYILEEEVDAED